MNSTAGYVYILINPSLNGIVKIGRTQNNPDQRAKELSAATGVPTPFIVVFSSYFKDCNAAEMFVHTLLANNRLAENREFFQVPIQQAIRALLEAEKSLGGKPEPDDNQVLQDEVTSTKPLAASKEVFHSANAHFYGIGDSIQDKSQALQLYIKAAKLGSISAYWKIGMMYLDEQGFKLDIERAKNAFMDGTRVNNDLCWAGLAHVFVHLEEMDNWDKSWNKYFNSSFFMEKKQFVEYADLDVIMSDRAYQMYAYGIQAATMKWKMSQKTIIQANKLEISDFMKLHRSVLSNSPQSILQWESEKRNAEQKEKEYTRQEAERKLKEITSLFGGKRR